MGTIRLNSCEKCHGSLRRTISRWSNKPVGWIEYWRCMNCGHKMKTMPKEK